jgi:ribosome maturation factor RimP
MKGTHAASTEGVAIAGTDKRRTPAVRTLGILPRTHFPSCWRNGRAAPIFFERGQVQVYEKERQLHRDVAEKVERALPDVEVLAVELRGPEALAVYVDRPDGVDHALCEQVTNVLREYLNDYSLEVSSPGLERPLRTRQHFEQYVGRRVALRTASEIRGRKRFRGELVHAGEAAVMLGRGEEIPYDQIVRGNLIDEGLSR